MLKCVITAACIGILGGFWFALANGSIELFQNYVEGAWRYQFAVRSFVAPIVGLVVGALSGANIRLGLAPERADGFERGAIIGAAVGILLVLAQIVLVALAANFGDYRTPYQSLLTRFSGIIFFAAIIGAAVGMLTRNRPPVGILPGAAVGALIGISFVLPVVVAVALIVASAPGIVSGTNLIPLYAPHLVSPAVGAAVAAIVAAVADRLTPANSQDALTFISVAAGAVSGVTASSTSFFYVLARQSPPVAIFYEFHIGVGLLLGVAVGIGALAVGRKVALRQAQP